MILTSEYTKGGLARAVPGAYYHERAWHIDQEHVTPRAARIILKLFPAAVAAEPWLAERARAGIEGRPVDKATPYRDQHGHAEFPRVEAILAAKGWALHEFQRTDLTYQLALLTHHKGGYVGWQMGLGKTLGTCALIDAWDANYNLIVCGNAAKTLVWEPALNEFTPWIPTYVLPNAKAKREAMLDELTGSEEPFNLIVHYEALAIVAGAEETKGGAWKPGDGWKRLGPFDLTVMDEGHRLKNAKAKFVKSAFQIPSVGRLLLSGSIAENHLEELWVPIKWMWPKVYTAKWRQWNYKYLDYIEPDGRPTCIGPKEERLHELRDEMGTWLTYRRSADELDIPEAHRRRLLVDISPGQRRVYAELERELRSVLDDGTDLAVELGLSLLSKLRQVATGLDLLGEVSDSTKLDAAEELIRDGEDESFVVFGWYRATLDALAERLDEPVSVVHGGVPQKRRTEEVHRHARGETRILLATIATLAESVNLQHASQVIFLDRDWNPMKNEQAEARVVRQGQTKNVGVTHIIARATVDELNVMPALASKEALRALVLGG